MRLDEYDWKGLPPDLIEWLQDCTELINLGKYSTRNISVPTSLSAGYEGEFGIAKDGNYWYLFVYTGATDTWKKVLLSDL